MKKILNVFVLLGFIQILLLAMSDIFMPQISSIGWKVLFSLYIDGWFVFASVNFLIILGLIFICGCQPVEGQSKYGDVKVGSCITPS